MQIILVKAATDDAEDILAMQKIAFAPLLEKYKDYETNPAAESLDKVKARLQSKNIHIYFIESGENRVGLIRLVVDTDVINLKQILILPCFQKKGYAREALLQAERLYPEARRWQLDTILQEERLCRLYSNAGYVPTGKIEKINENMSLIYFSKQL